MSFYREDYVKVKKNFEDRRRNAEDKALEDKRKIACADIPGLKEICDKLDTTGPRVYAAALEGKESYAKKLMAIRRENEELLKKQSELLLSHGYPEDYFDIEYNCPICHDEGNVNGKMCVCMKNELIKAGYESSGISGLCDKMSFDTFDLSYYSGADRKNMEVIVERARDFAEDFRDTGSGSILFFGGTGLGKTHLSVAVAKRVIEGGHWCVYTTAGTLFTDLRDTRFTDDKSERDNINKYYDCELLVIDDLGTELNGRDVVPFLYNLLNSRINTKKSTLISTNLSQNKLLELYDDRIVSRLFGEFLPFRFTGKDVRMQKLQR